MATLKPATSVKTDVTHWADVAAHRLIEARPNGPYRFATAITPSGPIHVGNMREVLTTEAVFRSVTELGHEAELIYIADDFDPLRKVYPFLPPEYEEHVGKPLREIPCLCGDHRSYSDHFLQPFLDNLEQLGINPRVMSAYDMYHEGDYTEAITQAMDNMGKIREIIEEESGRQLPRFWAPFNPQCPTCGRISGVEVIGYESPLAACRCTHCAFGPDEGQRDLDGDGEGDPGTFDVNVQTPGAGKLPWRVDWPARWDFLRVKFEAFGKDHGAKGGSWDTGIRIAREIFERREPEHIIYEFLNLKGQGAMHGSTGLAVSAQDLLSMTPPEVLRYLLMRQSPRKHIDFDPGLGILSLVDEFDRFERINFGAEENPGMFTEVERTYQLSCPGEIPATLPSRASYKHLVTVVQMADTIGEIAEILQRSGELAPDADMAALAQRIEHVGFWLENFAPDSIKFKVQEELPRHDFTDDDSAFLLALTAVLDPIEWTGEKIHDAIYLAKGERSPAVAFKAIYQAILGQDKGPRAGFFLASLNKNWVIQRLLEAAGS